MLWGEISRFGRRKGRKRRMRKKKAWKFRWAHTDHARPSGCCRGKGKGGGGGGGPSMGPGDEKIEGNDFDSPTIGSGFSRKGIVKARQKVGEKRWERIRKVVLWIAGEGGGTAHQKRLRV